MFMITYHLGESDLLAQISPRHPGAQKKSCSFEKQIEYKGTSPRTLPNDRGVAGTLSWFGGADEFFCLHFPSILMVQRGTGSEVTGWPAILVSFKPLAHNSPNIPIKAAPAQCVMGHPWTLSTTAPVILSRQHRHKASRTPQTHTHFCPGDSPWHNLCREPWDSQPTLASASAVYQKNPQSAIRPPGPLSSSHFSRVSLAWNILGHPACTYFSFSTRVPSV